MESKSVVRAPAGLPRRRYTPKQILEYLNAQPQSGLTITAFCQQQGFHPSVFYGWKRKHRQVVNTVPGFQEVSLPALMDSAWVTEITLPSGAVLRFSAQADWSHLQPWLAKLLRS